MEHINITGKEVQLFPVRLREYRHPDPEELNSKLLDAFVDYPAMQSNFPEGVITSRPDLHNFQNEHVQRLIAFFADALAEYRNHFKLYCDNLDIPICWFNHAPAGTGFGHPLHRHPMSYLSAVYYLTEGAPTYFEDPCTPRTSDTLDIFQHDLMDKPEGINERVDAEPGKLILFPSWLKHYSGRQLENFDRWTISFNAFPVGRINVGPWDCPQLNIRLLNPTDPGMIPQ